MNKYIEFTNYYNKPGHISDGKVLVEYAKFMFDTEKIPVFPTVSAFKVGASEFEIIRNSTLTSKITVTEFGTNNGMNKIREINMPNGQAYDFVLTVLKYMKGVRELNLIDWEVDFELKQRSTLWNERGIDAREIICFSKCREPIVKLTDPYDEKALSSIYLYEEYTPGFDETKVVEDFLKKHFRKGGN